MRWLLYVKTTYNQDNIRLTCMLSSLPGARSMFLQYYTLYSQTITDFDTDSENNLLHCLNTHVGVYDTLHLCSKDNPSTLQLLSKHMPRVTQRLSKPYIDLDTFRFVMQEYTDYIDNDSAVSFANHVDLIDSLHKQDF